MMSWSQEKFYMVFGLELKKRGLFPFIQLTVFSQRHRQRQQYNN